MNGRILRYFAFGCLVSLAFLTRCIPVSISQYPFNNDALTECTLASQILTEGGLPSASSSLFYEEYSIDIPALNVLLATVASLIGCTPFDCAQFVVAVLSVITVAGVYVLGRLYTRSWHGGVAAGFGAALMGTFVFTTASVWKESLGICLLVFLLVAFVRRDRPCYRVIWVLVLLLLPLVHHLVAIVGLLTLAYPLSWSWFHAVSRRCWQRRHSADVISIWSCVVWTAVYYHSVSFDRLLFVSDQVLLLLFAVSVAGICLVMICVLSMRTHMRLTFSPSVAVFVGALVLMDYSGHLFPYEPAMSFWAVIVLVFSYSVLLGVGWYGTEVLIERNNRYRAVQLGLLLAPLTIVGIAFADGFSLLTHKVTYRTFDFFGPFIFLGVGTSFVWARTRFKGVHTAIGVMLIAALLVSFPFAYATDALTGIRHDTQAYEVDALEWVAHSSGYDRVVSDERLAYISRAMTGLPKDATFPRYILENSTLWRDACYLMEESWLRDGVNYYPYGVVAVTESYWSWTQKTSNVIYVGGPLDDRVIVIAPSRVSSLAYQSS